MGPGLAFHRRAYFSEGRGWGRQGEVVCPVDGEYLPHRVGMIKIFKDLT